MRRQQKIYDAGGERIVSKIVHPLTFITHSPKAAVRADFAGYMPLSRYKAKKRLMEAAINSSYQALGVPYLGVDRDSTSYPPNQLRMDNTSMKEDLIFFYHKDHLGSSNTILDSVGNILQWIEYLPYGEVMVDEQHSAAYATPYKFNGKELDEETGLLYYGARYFDPKIVSWLSTDLLENKSPNVSSYSYCHYNPIVLVDPDGNADYYGVDGQWLGKNNVDDQKVYLASRVELKAGYVINASDAQLLPISHDNLTIQAATVYGESSASYGIVDREEMFAIASVHQRNKIAYGANSPAASRYRKTLPSQRSNSMNIATAAVINAVIGGIDYSYGADQWDGAEQAMIPAADMKKPSNGRFMYKMNVMGWHMQDEHYSSWKQAVENKFGTNRFTVPQTQKARFNYGGMHNAGRIRLNSTAQYGLTMFWRTTK